MFDPVSDVRAPVGAVGWSVSRGWITDPDQLVAADVAATDVIYAVPDDGIVRDVVGAATIASLMHIDCRLLTIARELDELRAP